MRKCRKTLDVILGFQLCDERFPVEVFLTEKNSLKVQPLFIIIDIIFFYWNYFEFQPQIYCCYCCCTLGYGSCHVYYAQIPVRSSRRRVYRLSVCLFWTFCVYERLFNEVVFFTKALIFESHKLISSLLVIIIEITSEIRWLSVFLHSYSTILGPVIGSTKDLIVGFNSRGPCPRYGRLYKA